MLAGDISLAYRIVVRLSIAESGDSGRAHRPPTLPVADSNERFAKKKENDSIRFDSIQYNQLLIVNFGSAHL